MAESTANPNQTGEKLHYLEIVHLAAIRAVVYISNFYMFAKEKSGPFKTGVESVEVTVKTVVGPVYDRYHTLPFEILKFADRKVGDSVHELDRYVPDLARSVAGEVRRTGVVATAAGLAKSACYHAEPAAERLAVLTWRSLNRLPVFPQLARTVVPAAAGLSERYNRAVSCAAEKGYAVSGYLPLVPTERIAQVFDVAVAE